MSSTKTKSIPRNEKKKKKAKSYNSGKLSENTSHIEKECILKNLTQNGHPWRHILITS